MGLENNPQIIMHMIKTSVNNNLQLSWMVSIIFININAVYFSAKLKASLSAVKIIKRFLDSSLVNT